MTGTATIHPLEKQIYLNNHSLTGFSEVQLWQAFKNGNKDALSRLFRIYYKPLTVYGLNICSDPDFIKDCIQEVFLELWLYREKVNMVDSVKYYLLTCFRRRVMRNLETMNKNKHYDLTCNYTYTMTSSFEAEIISEQTDKQKKYYVTKELGNLTKRQQEAIYLKFYKGESYENIAVTMSLNYQSVKNLIHNGIKTLRGKLQHKELLS